MDSYLNFNYEKRSAQKRSFLIFLFLKKEGL